MGGPTVAIEMVFCIDVGLSPHDGHSRFNPPYSRRGFIQLSFCVVDCPPKGLNGGFRQRKGARRSRVHPRPGRVLNRCRCLTTGRSPRCQDRRGRWIHEGRMSFATVNVVEGRGLRIGGRGRGLGIPAKFAGSRSGVEPVSCSIPVICRICANGRRRRPGLAGLFMHRY